MIFVMAFIVFIVQVRESTLLLSFMKYSSCWIISGTDDFRD